jgi:regulator of ribosome biosynthesis
VEVPKDGDPMEDYIAKAGEEKKTKIEKNKKQQLKNQQGGVNKYQMANQSSVDSNNSKAAKMNALNSKITAAKYSTASLGKFDKVIKSEDKIARKGVKRQFEANTGDKKQEMERVKKIASSIANKN